MMAKVYHDGYQTLAWLGEADHRTRRAIVFLKASARQASDDSSLSSRLEQSEPDLVSGGTQGQEVSARQRWHRILWANLCRTRSWESVTSIIGRPYFRRAWVVQEIAKSKSVVFLCGKFDISWRDLANGCTPSNFLIPADDPVFALDAICRDELDLLEVAVMASSTQASDPRDKLYSILGLVEDDSINVDVHVDYSKDHEEVFFAFIKQLLLASPKLRALCMSYGSSPAKPRHIPSWVWNPQPDKPHERFSVSLYGINLYQAAQNSECQPNFSGSMLGLRGIALQTVTTLSSAWTAVPQSRMLLSFGPMQQFLQLGLLYSEYRTIGGLCGVPADSVATEQRRKALWRTARPHWGLQTTSDEAEQFLNFLTWRKFDSEYMELFGRYVPGESERMTSWSRFKLLLRIQAMIFGIWLGSSALIDFVVGLPPFWQLSNRRLAKTDTGQLALCPKETSVIDRLVILQGSDVLFILRPIGDHWQIVGECYVPELMDGSAWDETRCEMLWIE